jgi:HAD superfamily hydrolase (TIGR01509 family)
MTSWPRRVDTVLLDVDGTLVDTTYLHTVAWVRAFRDHGYDVASWRAHRAVGMGGDRLVTAVAGEEAEEAHGDDLRGSWERHYDAMLDEVAPLPGARELLTLLRDSPLRVALVSSGIPRHTRRALDVLGVRDPADVTTTSEDAESSKPDPEPLEQALERVDADRAVLVGDSVWDVESAGRAGVPVIGVLTGGFGRAELEEAGAAPVLDDPAALVARWDELVQPAE